MIGDRLATLDPETYERPTSRIGNAGNARQLVKKLKYEDQTRMLRSTREDGLLDGNPPWPQKRLQDLGQGHRANFNLREGEGIVDSAKTPYYDLVFEVPYFAQITFQFADADTNVNQQWSDIISEEYYETVCAWTGFDQNIQTHQWQMVVKGIGPIFWPHAISWYCEAIKKNKVLVPQETKANVEQLEQVWVLHSWRADELESYIAGAPKDAEEYNGWNVPLCKKAIVDSANREMRQSFGGIENYDLYQRAIRTGDIFHGINNSSRIYVASGFIKEFGGKVSQYIFTDQVLGEGDETFIDVTDETGYLYKRKGKFDNFTQVICPGFFDTAPDGTWHSVKGLGPKIYDFCDVSNRMTCQMLDGAVIGSGITLEAQEGAALEETQLALVGGATVVQPGYKVVQTRIAESLNGAMAMKRELQNTLQSNTGSYRQRTSEENHEPTLGQAQMNYQQQALLSKGATNRYYNGFLDNLHTETLRRLMDPAQNKRIPGGKEAMEFQARCIRRGIPLQVFKFENILKVRSVRSVGYGSPQLRDMATKELISLIPLMDEVSKNHALRARATALPGIGPSNVDQFFPKIENSGVPNAHTAFAVAENNALRTLGGQAMVEPQQNHSIHFDTHMQDVKQHQQDQTAQPHDLLIHMEQAGPHLLKHLNALKGDPTRKNEVKQKQQQLDEMGKETDRLSQNVQEQAQSAAQQPNGQGQGQPDLEGLAKVAKVHGDLGLKQKKMEGDQLLKAQGQKFKQTLADKEAAAKITRETAMAKTDAQIKQMQAQAQERATLNAATGGGQ